MSLLQGIKILDLTRLYPGPFASMILSDYGASVISVDSPSSARSIIPTLYRNKKLIIVDMKKKEGLDILLKLASRSDIFIEGFRPGIAHNMGIGYEDVRKVKEDIIYCSITGYGQKGRFKSRPGHDVNYLGESGVLSLMGAKDGPPVIPGVQIADVLGALYAVNSILAAVYKREKTGYGEYIDISLTDSASTLLSLPFYMEFLFHEKQRRGDFILAHRYPCYEIYETGDGKFITIGCLEPHFWKNLCEILGLEEFIPFQFDDSKKDEIKNKLVDIFMGKPAIWFENLFEGRDVCFSIVNDMDDVKKSFLSSERDMIFPVETEDGEIFSPGMAAKFDNGMGLNIKMPAPGEDAYELLKGMGLSDEDIAGLISSGIVYEKI